MSHDIGFALEEFQGKSILHRTFLGMGNQMGTTVQAMNK
jgi:hypothetical protein